MAIPHDVPTVLGRVRVHVSEPVSAGSSARTILMWPSLLMDGSLWHDQVDHFAGRYRVVTVDPPGQGASEHLTRDIEIDDCVECLVAILDHLGVELTHVVGSSWGAMVGGSFAALHPERIDRLVLLNGSASRAPTLQRAQYAVLLASARLLGGIRWPLTRLVARAFVGRTTRRTRPHVVAEVVAAARRNDVRSASHAVRGVVPGRPHLLDRFGSITAPALIVAGFEDRTFPLWEVQAMAGALPGSTLVVISDAAHLLALEVPEQVNGLIEEFLTAGEHRTIPGPGDEGRRG